MKAPIADGVERIVRAYRSALLLPNAQAVDYTRDVISHGSGGHGKHGATATPTFGPDAPLAVRIERWLTNAAALWEHELEQERKGAASATLPPELVEMAAALNGIASPRGQRADKKSGSKRAEDRMILATKGDSIVVGLLFARSSEGIRKLRDRHQQDPHTGEHAPRPTPLSAPIRDQLQHHESATTTTEDS